MKDIKGLTEGERKAVVELLESVTAQTVTTIKDIRSIDKLCKIIETAGGDISLEDADYAYLKQRIGSATGLNPRMRNILIPIADKLGLEE